MRSSVADASAIRRQLDLGHQIKGVSSTSNCEHVGEAMRGAIGGECAPRHARRPGRPWVSEQRRERARRALTLSGATAGRQCVSLNESLGRAYITCSHSVMFFSGKAGKKRQKDLMGGPGRPRPKTGFQSLFKSKRAGVERSRKTGGQGCGGCGCASFAVAVLAVLGTAILLA